MHVCRALVFVVKFFDGKVPAATSKGMDAVAELGASVGAKVQEYVAAMEKVRLRMTRSEQALTCHL